MGNNSSNITKSKNVSISYLSPCLYEYKEKRGFFGFSKEAGKIYMCVGDQYTREDVENPALLSIYNIDILDFTQSGSVLIVCDGDAIKFEKLESGKILSYRLNSAPFDGMKVQIINSSDRKFVPQGHEKFDKLAVLFNMDNK